LAFWAVWQRHEKNLKKYIMRDTTHFLKF